MPVLHPTLLPEYGSNTEDAIETALELAVNGGYQQGDLLLITDEVSRSAFNSIQSMISKAGKFRLSILGVGTQQGAPIPTGAGGFAKDPSGAIIIPKLSPASLQMLAQNNGGIYAGMSADDSDIEALLATTEELFPDATKELERSFDLWDDQGFWLVFLLLPIIVLSFRRGNIALILLAPLLFSDPVSALGWQDLWKTADQQASEALENGDAAAAQSLFKDPEWRGSAAYKAGDYESAINEFLDFDNADSHYNRGNALAHSGDLDAAIEAYDQALAMNPEMADAQANKELLEQLKTAAGTAAGRLREIQEQSDSSQQQQDSSTSNLRRRISKLRTSSLRHIARFTAARIRSASGARSTARASQIESERTGVSARSRHPREQQREQQESQEQKPEQQASETRRHFGECAREPNKRNRPSRNWSSGCGAFRMIQAACCGRNSATSRGSAHWSSRRPAPPDDDQRAALVRATSAMASPIERAIQQKIQ